MIIRIFVSRDEVTPKVAVVLTLNEAIETIISAFKPASVSMSKAQQRLGGMMLRALRRKLMERAGG